MQDYFNRFFTAFRMTFQMRFFVILNELFSEEESLQKFVGFGKTATIFYKVSITDYSGFFTENC